MLDLSLLLMRLTVGGLLAGHGAQKLFGAFDGPGMERAGGMMDSLGMRPGHHWVKLAVFSELGGGSATALGLLSPLGPIASMGSMVLATTMAHWGKPIWNTSGGAELPVTNLAMLGALALAGPGRISMDRLFGVRVPGWLTGLAVIGLVGGVAQAHLVRQSTPTIHEEPAPLPSSATDAQAATIEPTELPSAA